ncbi:MAG: hypothetical protein Kow0013_30180 [Pararhodobacter sp.]
MIDPDHERLSIRRQRELVSISRTSFCRHPAGESPRSLGLMRVIDEPSWRRPGKGRARRRGIRAADWRARREPGVAPADRPVGMPVQVRAE